MKPKLKLVAIGIKRKGEKTWTIKTSKKEVDLHVLAQGIKIIEIEK